MPCTHLLASNILFDKQIGLLAGHSTEHVLFKLMTKHITHSMIKTMF